MLNYLEIKKYKKKIFIDPLLSFDFFNVILFKEKNLYFCVLIFAKLEISQNFLKLKILFSMRSQRK